MPDAGDIVIAAFPGVKCRPAVVLSSADYHAARPDIIIIGLITSQTASAGAITVSAAIGRLSNRDMEGVRKCVRIALLDLQVTSP